MKSVVYRLSTLTVRAPAWCFCSVFKPNLNWFLCNSVFFVRIRVIIGTIQFTSSGWQPTFFHSSPSHLAHFWCRSWPHFKPCTYQPTSPLDLSNALVAEWERSYACQVQHLLWGGWIKWMTEQHLAISATFPSQQSHPIHGVIGKVCRGEKGCRVWAYFSQLLSSL